MAIRLLNAIDTIYENCSVYQSIIIVNSIDDANDVLEHLLQNDYPAELATFDGLTKMAQMESRVLIVCVETDLRNPQLINELNQLKCIDTIIIDDEPPLIDCVQELVTSFPSAREIYVGDN